MLVVGDRLLRWGENFSGRGGARGGVGCVRGGAFFKFARTKPRKSVLEPKWKVRGIVLRIDAVKAIARRSEWKLLIVKVKGEDERSSLPRVVQFSPSSPYAATAAIAAAAPESGQLGIWPEAARNILLPRCFIPKDWCRL